MQSIISLVVVVLLILDFDIASCTDGNAAPYHIIQPPNNDYVQIASPDAAMVTLMCSLNVSIPAGMTITWLHNDTIILTITSQAVGGTNTASLIRGGPAPSLVGHYQCVFNDNAGHIQRRDITLLVSYTPRIIQPSADFHRVTFNELTSSVRLMCSLDIIIPSNVTVAWTHNGTIVMLMHRNEVTQAGDTTTLHIRSPQLSDAGEYQCVFSGLDLQRTISLEFYGSASSTTFMVATSVTVSTKMATITSQSTTERVYRSTSSANSLINATTTTAIVPTTRSVSTSDSLSIVITTTSTNVNSTLVSLPMATFSTSQTNKNTSIIVIAVIATLVVVILVTCTITVAVVGTVIYHKKKKAKYSNQSGVHSNATYGVTMQRFSSNASEPVDDDPNEQNNDNRQYVNISTKKKDNASCHVYSVPHGHIKLQPNPSYGYLSGTTELLEKRDYYI